MALQATAAAASETLPGPLRRFFEKYPPKLYSAKFTGVTIPLTRRQEQLAKETQHETTESSTPSTESEASPVPVAPNPSEDGEVSHIETASPIPTSRATRPPPNPFMPFRNPETGRWRGPVYGLRRQADLVKAAKANGIEELLPPGYKSTAFKEHRMLTRGLQVKGTGEGQTVKGHKWERTMASTLEKRRKAMEEMPELIRKWKQTGHGRGWKKYPK